MGAGITTQPQLLLPNHLKQAPKTQQNNCQGQQEWSLDGTAGLGFNPGFTPQLCKCEILCSGTNTLRALMTSQELISSPMKYLIERKTPKSNTRAHWKTLQTTKNILSLKADTHSAPALMWQRILHQWERQRPGLDQQLPAFTGNFHFKSSLFFVIKKKTSTSHFIAVSFLLQNTNSQIYPGQFPSPHAQKQLQPKHFLLPTAGAQEGEEITPDTPSRVGSSSQTPLKDINSQEWQIIYSDPLRVTNSSFQVCSGYWCFWGGQNSRPRIKLENVFSPVAAAANGWFLQFWVLWIYLYFQFLVFGSTADTWYPEASPPTGFFYHSLKEKKNIYFITFFFNQNVWQCESGCKNCHIILFCMCDMVSCSYSGPAPVETQEYPFPQVFRENGPLIYPISKFLIKTKKLSFNFTCAPLKKYLKIKKLNSTNKLFKKLKTHKTLLHLI